MAAATDLSAISLSPDPEKPVRRPEIPDKFNIVVLMAELLRSNDNDPWLCKECPADQQFVCMNKRDLTKHALQQHPISFIKHMNSLVAKNGTQQEKEWMDMCRASARGQAVGGNNQGADTVSIDCPDPPPTTPKIVIPAAAAQQSAAPNVVKSRSGTRELSSSSPSPPPKQVASSNGGGGSAASHSTSGGSTIASSAGGYDRRASRSRGRSQSRKRRRGSGSCSSDETESQKRTRDRDPRIRGSYAYRARSQSQAPHRSRSQAPTYSNTNKHTDALIIISDEENDAVVKVASGGGDGEIECLGVVQSSQSGRARSEAPSRGRGRHRSQRSPDSSVDRSTSSGRNRFGPSYSQSGSYYDRDRPGASGTNRLPTTNQHRDRVRQHELGRARDFNQAESRDQRHK